MEQVRAVVLGGGGFIGSHLVSYLKNKGYFVRAVDREFPELRKKWWSNADEVYHMDLRSWSNTCESLLGMDYVFHLAADMGGVGYFTKNDYYPYIANQTMNLNVLAAAEQLHTERLFFSSSACIYPTHLQQDVHNPLICKESDVFPAQSDQMYGWDKLMMSMLCERSPLDARVGIFHTIYGPGQETEGERVKFPPAIVKKVLESKKTGEPIKIWGDGTQQRTFLYIDDAVEKIHQIMTKPYEGWVNVAGSELINVADTARLVCELTDTPPIFLYEGDKPSGVLARDADNTKFIETYDYINKTDLKKGFSLLIKWVEQN